MKTRLINIVLWIAFILAMGGCQVALEDKRIITDSPPYGVYRFHDDEKGVTCWQVTYGLSCLPDSQLKGYGE